MNESRINELFARKLSGEASPEELQELKQLLLEEPEEALLQELVASWYDPNTISQTSPAFDSNDHFASILKRSFEYAQTPSLEDYSIQIQRKHKRKLILYAVAATITGLLIFLLGSLYFKPDFKPNPSSHQINEIVTQPGIKTKIRLPDGTQVWLNADSRLTYKKSFDDSLREVSLEGEAYFDVVKNPSRPFIVHTSAINIKVLGTAFDVKSYPQDPSIEATLVRGLIQVEQNGVNNNAQIMLHPNEKLTYNKPDSKFSVSGEGKKKPDLAADTLKQSISIARLPGNIADSVRKETSWVYGKLVFEGDSFLDLSTKMERWFNVKIIFKDKKTESFRFAGAFQHENIEEALQALQMTASFGYTLEGNIVTIRKK